jgi:F0F1-type ATP synthase membrane subunit c/vacuolar-type H+-ATPase subunit K
MVLDSEGVSKAATDRAMYVRLKVAYDDGHRVLTSAAVLAEVLRGTSRDAGLHRVLARVAVEPVSEAIGQRAGHLIGAAGMSAAQAVDAIVAATAIAEAEQAEAADQVASVLIVTSDLPDLTRLVAGQTGVAVVHVGRLGNPY